MRVLFVHDHIFCRVGTDYYSPGGLPAKILERYIHHFDSLTVVGRGRCVSEPPVGFSLSSTSGVDFKLLYRVGGGYDYYLHKKYITDHLERCLDDCDVAVLRFPSTLALFASTICRRLGKPYVAEVVGCGYDLSRHYSNRAVRVMALYNFISMRRSVRGALGSIYVTEKFLQRRYPCGGITSWASDVAINTTPQEVLELRFRKIERLNSQLVLGMVGNIAMSYKGYDVALKALKLLAGRGFSVMLRIVGGGDPSEILRMAHSLGVEDLLILEGVVKSGCAVESFLDQVDIFIHPSLSEGMPRSVIEAMSRGCPVLTSAAGGLPELIEPQHIHPIGDYRTLAAQIEALSSNKSALTTMARRNFIASHNHSSAVTDAVRNDFFEKIKSALQ